MFNRHLASDGLVGPGERRASVQNVRRATSSMANQLFAMPSMHTNEGRATYNWDQSSHIYDSDQSTYFSGNIWDHPGYRDPVRSLRGSPLLPGSNRQALHPSSNPPVSALYGPIIEGPHVLSSGQSTMPNSAYAMLGAGKDTYGQAGQLANRLAALPYHKQTLLSGMKGIAKYSQTLEHAIELLEFCIKAEQEQATRELPSRLTDRFLEPVTRPLTAKGIGSRRGLESYRCLWPKCLSKATRKANAVSHLLSHVQYKPYVCNEW
jgi:hypothetical protein